MIVDCDECDGVGWTEGGEALQSKCKKCRGTGLMDNGIEDIPGRYATLSDRALLELVLEKIINIEAQMQVDESTLDAAVSHMTTTVDAIQLHFVAISEQLANGNVAAAQAEVASAVAKFGTLSAHLDMLASEDTDSGVVDPNAGATGATGTTGADGSATS